MPSATKKSGSESYVAGWGPNEYNPTGSLGGWEYRDQIQKMKEPALIIDGTDDLCTPFVAKTMSDLIPNAKWELFQGCRHMCFVEENARYCKVVSDWMNQND